jgi:hypothetical protein
MFGGGERCQDVFAALSIVSIALIMFTSGYSTKALPENDAIEP